MNILTAKVAGVQTVVGCTPPILGKIPNATVAAMYYAGADKIWVLEGVQAVATMACGTETMPKVHFIAGPGNAFVAPIIFETTSNGSIRGRKARRNYDMIQVMPRT